VLSEGQCEAQTWQNGQLVYPLISYSVKVENIVAAIGIGGACHHFKLSVAPKAYSPFQR